MDKGKQQTMRVKDMKVADAKLVRDTNSQEVEQIIISGLKCKLCNSSSKIGSKCLKKEGERVTVNRQLHIGDENWTCSFCTFKADTFKVIRTHVIDRHFCATIGELIEGPCNNHNYNHPKGLPQWQDNAPLYTDQGYVMNQGADGPQ